MASVQILVQQVTRITGTIHLNNLQSCSISEQKKYHHEMKALRHLEKQTLSPIVKLKLFCELIDIIYLFEKYLIICTIILTHL